MADELISRLADIRNWPGGISRAEHAEILARLRAGAAVVEAAWGVTNYFRDDYEEVLRPLNDALAAYGATPKEGTPDD